MTDGAGYIKWGLADWGIGTQGLLSGTIPQIIFRYPNDEQEGVHENVVIQIQFAYPTSPSSTDSRQIYVQDALVYDSKIGFQAGAVGHAQTRANVTLVQVYMLDGFDFGQRVEVSARALSLGDILARATCTFKVRENTACYNGLSVLPVELRMQRPYVKFLGIDIARQLFLASALRRQGSVISQQASKATRVIYQTAYATELSTLLNPFFLKDTAALQSTVCEKQTLLEIDKVIMDYRNQWDSGIEDFRRLGIFKDDYISSFQAQLDSTSYQHRMSLVASLIMYAAAYEMRA